MRGERGLDVGARGEGREGIGLLRVRGEMREGCELG